MNAISMKTKWSVAAALVALVLVASGCQKLKARDHLNKGVQSFKSAKYAEAVEHFEKAIELDPEFTTARGYLATAYMSQYIPGAESPENQQNAEAAENNFLKVLEQEEDNTHAISSLASLHYSQAQGTLSADEKRAKLEEARKWYERLAQTDPNSKEAFYSLGVISWANWYPRLMEARAKLGMQPEEPGPLKDKKVREELREQWMPTIESGVNNLQKALEIDPEYVDAMAYMNLLIRERADLAATKEEYKKDIETAENWVQKALDTRKILAERLAQKGIQAAE